MICLSNTDVIEGLASVTSVVDYTIYGLSSGSFARLAQGQLSNSQSVLFTASAAISIVSIVLVNTHSDVVEVDLFVDPANGGTPRRLIPKNLKLGAGYSLHFDGQRCSVIDREGNELVGGTGSRSSTSYYKAFVNSDLSGGAISIAHSFGRKYVHVVVFDNNDKVIVPDEIVLIDEDTVSVDLSSYVPISGTWHALILDSGATYSVASPLAISEGGTGASTASGARSNLNVKTLSEILDAVYPVGSIYISVNSTNPGTIFGIGTWAAFGTGRVLVGVDTSQSEFDTVEKTGGAKTHTLTTNEMPGHYHLVGFAIARGQENAYGTCPVSDVNTGFEYHTSYTGGGQAHNNLQPYITVYMWKRTA